MIKVIALNPKSQSRSITIVITIIISFSIMFMFIDYKYYVKSSFFFLFLYSYPVGTTFESIEKLVFCIYMNRYDSIFILFIIMFMFVVIKIK